MLIWIYRCSSLAVFGMDLELVGIEVPDCFSPGQVVDICECICYGVGGMGGSEQWSGWVWRQQQPLNPTSLPSLSPPTLAQAGWGLSRPSSLAQDCPGAREQILTFGGQNYEVCHIGTAALPHKELARIGLCFAFLGISCLYYPGRMGYFLPLFFQTEFWSLAYCSELFYL